MGAVWTLDCLVLQGTTPPPKSFINPSGCLGSTMMRNRKEKKKRCHSSGKVFWRQIGPPYAGNRGVRWEGKKKTVLWHFSKPESKKIQNPNYQKPHETALERDFENSTKRSSEGRRPTRMQVARSPMIDCCFELSDQLSDQSSMATSSTRMRQSF